MRALVVVLAFCGVADADPEHGWQATPSLLVGVEDFDYHEDVAPPTASKHHGDQLTSRIEVEVIPPIRALYARAIAGFTNGKMPFMGTDQAGNPITPTADAAGHMTDLELELGYRYRMRDHVWLGGYVGIGRRTWDRDLRPISGGYREDYAWLTFPVGVEADVVVAEGLVLQLEGTAMFTNKGTMRLHLSDYDPTYSDLDIALNNQPGARARVRGVYAFGAHIRFLAEATYEYSWMTEGDKTQIIQNGVPIAMSASEPETHTQRISLLLGIGYQF